MHSDQFILMYFIPEPGISFALLDNCKFRNLQVNFGRMGGGGGAPKPLGPSRNAPTRDPTPTPMDLNGSDQVCNLSMIQQQ